MWLGKYVTRCDYVTHAILICCRMHERGETTTLTVEKDGLFDVAVNKILSVERLKPETTFQCLLTIPGTSFSVREETMYFPGKGELHLSCKLFLCN